MMKKTTTVKCLVHKEETRIKILCSLLHHVCHDNSLLSNVSICLNKNFQLRRIFKGGWGGIKYLETSSISQ